MLLCRLAGIEAAADHFPALPAAALTVQSVVTVDNGGPAPTFAYHKGKTDAASESRGSLLTMPSRKEEKTDRS